MKWLKYMGICALVIIVASLIEGFTGWDTDYVVGYVCGVASTYLLASKLQIGKG